MIDIDRYTQTLPEDNLFGILFEISRAELAVEGWRTALLNMSDFGCQFFSLLKYFFTLTLAKST